MLLKTGGRRVYDESEIEAVVRVLRTRRLELINGPAVREFEGLVAALFGKTHGVMTNSGSSANMLAVAALDLAPGSEVITPACTFGTTVAPLVQQHLVPAFVDVELDTFQIDAGKVEEAITPRTRAMMVPNLIGNLGDWPRLRQIADAHGLKVIEDSADTIGSLIAGRPIGALSDISTTSFYASHIITCAGAHSMANEDVFQACLRINREDPALLYRIHLLTRQSIAMDEARVSCSGIVRELTGESEKVLLDAHSSVIFSIPNEDRLGWSWHQESNYDALGAAGATVCFPVFEPATKKNGTASFLKRSHQLGTLPCTAIKKYENGSTSLVPKDIDRLSQKYEEVHFEAEVGDVGVLHRDLVHRSNTNTDTKPRITGTIHLAAIDRVPDNLTGKPY